MHRILWSGLAALLIVSGCTAETGGSAALTKDEAATDVALGNGAGKADDTDFCEELDWYGDGICDWFCPLEDQDCTGAECTVGADSTCIDGEQCQPGRCLFGCALDNPDCCDPASCAPSPDFCTRINCAPGYYCDAEAETCTPTEDSFCTRALCAPGTICDEDTDSCVPVDECSPVLCALYCPYGFESGDDGCGTCRCAERPIDACSPVVCEIACEFGFETGDDGCETCACAVPPHGEPLGCRRGGCSSQLCLSVDMPPIYTTCEWRPEYACVQQQLCERQPGGECGFTDTGASDTCFDAL